MLTIYSLLNHTKNMSSSPKSLNSNFSAVRACKRAVEHVYTTTYFLTVRLSVRHNGGPHRLQTSKNILKLVFTLNA